MSYKIIYTQGSEQDLKMFTGIFRYIAMNLLVPETAKKQADRIMMGPRNETRIGRE